MTAYFNLKLTSLIQNRFVSLDKNINKMSMRDKFLKDFNSISNKFSENVSVYYALDFRTSLGISYFEINRISNELSQYFSKLFGKNPQFVGVSLSNYFLLPSLILGIWKSGCCFAGVGSQYTLENTVDYLNFLGVKYVISDKNESDCGGKLFSQFVIHQQQFFIWDRQSQEEIYLGALENICYGLMTSGTTGKAKIVQVPWSCILPNVAELSEEFQVTEHDCIFQASPYSFDPFFIELLIGFLNGCSLLVVSNEVKLCPLDLLKILFKTRGKEKFELSPLKLDYSKKVNYFHINVQEVKKKNISILQMTPSVFRRWTDNEIKEFILSPDTSLKILILGGEKFPKEILNLKCSGNKTRIFNIYGITEISCWAFLNEVTNFAADVEISLGKPLNDIIYEISENGELEIGSLTRICLLNKENISQVENPVFRKTGDIVKFVNKELYYLGRSNQEVKKYGIKINLNKIEELFMSKNKLIKESFCVFDEESLKLGLFYVPVTSKSSAVAYEPKAFEQFLNEHYEIPVDGIKDIEKPDYLIEITKVPLNFHGKCDRHQLLKYLKSIKPEESDKDLERIFRRLWINVLNIKKVSMLSSSFTELGGNSILGINLINKLEDEGFKVPQNFIAKLLGGKSYDDCLKCLSLALEKYEVPKKRIKFDANVGDVKLSVRWKFDLEKCVDASPAVFTYQGEDRIVIGSHSSKLSCLNADTGSEIWTIFLGDRIESGFKLSKDGSKGFIGCYDHYVYCIATSDGKVIWKFRTGDMVKSTPCLSTDEEVVYVGSYDKNLYCLSALDGQIKNSFKLSGGSIFCSGVVSDSLNSFYTGTLDGTCAAINQETNELTWRIILGSPVFASPCLIPDRTEVLFSEVLGNVHSLNALNGNKMFTFRADGNIYSSPVVVKVNNINQIIFGCHDAYLYCLQYTKEPELKWKQQLDSSIFARPSIVLEWSSVCAATTKGFICICDFSLGSVKTRLKLDGEVFSSAVYYNNRLSVGCRDNYVYSIDISKKES